MESSVSASIGEHFNQCKMELFSILETIEERLEYLQFREDCANQIQERIQENVDKVYFSLERPR